MGKFQMLMKRKPNEVDNNNPVEVDTLRFKRTTEENLKKKLPLSPSSLSSDSTEPS